MRNHPNNDAIKLENNTTWNQIHKRIKQHRMAKKNPFQNAWAQHGTAMTTTTWQRHSDFASNENAKSSGTHLIRIEKKNEREEKKRNTFDSLLYCLPLSTRYHMPNGLLIFPELFIRLDRFSKLNCRLTATSDSIRPTTFSVCSTDFNTFIACEWGGLLNETTQRKKKHERKYYTHLSDSKRPSGEYIMCVSILNFRYRLCWHAIADAFDRHFGGFEFGSRLLLLASCIHFWNQFWLIPSNSSEPLFHFIPCTLFTMCIDLWPSSSSMETRWVLCLISSQIWAHIKYRFRNRMHWLKRLWKWAWAILIRILLHQKLIVVQCNTQWIVACHLHCNQ